MSQSTNILIGNAGVASQTGTIKIGTTATHTDTYIGGIYNQTVASPNKIVVVGSNDQLGTIDEPSSLTKFLYIQTSNATAVTGDGTQYPLGSSVALTKIFDVNNDMTTGGVFTAPATGYYSITVGVCLNNLTYPSAFLPPHQFMAGSNGGILIVVSGTSARTYTSTMPWDMSGQATNYMPTAPFVVPGPPPPPYMDQQAATITHLVTMTAGDTAVFKVSIIGDAALSYGLDKSTGIGPIAHNPFSLNATFVSGFQVA